MPAGDVAVLTDHQRSELTRLVQKAEKLSGLTFSVYVGALANGRETALGLHGQLQDPAVSVLVAVDPNERELHIITGRQARIGLTNHACSLAAMSMTSSFNAGDLLGGLRDGLIALGEQGRSAPVLHVRDV